MVSPVVWASARQGARRLLRPVARPLHVANQPRLFVPAQPQTPAPAGLGFSGSACLSRAGQQSALWPRFSEGPKKSHVS